MFQLGIGVIDSVSYAAYQLIDFSPLDCPAGSVRELESAEGTNK